MILINYYSHFPINFIHNNSVLHCITQLNKALQKTPQKPLHNQPSNQPNNQPNNLINHQINKQHLVIAFYNVENLFDTVNNVMVSDDEFTPHGEKHYTEEIYKDKLLKLATVLHDIGKDMVATGPAILGIAEIENDTVLYDLTRHFLLRKKKLKFIHFDSKDARGVDVALLYNPALFIPYNATPLEVKLPGNSKESAHTRDILYVQGNLAGEQVHIYVNHWPSRRGGEERSAPAREAAATICRKHIDSIRLEHENAKIIVMGDLNDNPTDKSIRKTLEAVGSYTSILSHQLYNPWIHYYNQGLGTLANRDVWGLFDQILLSAAFTKPVLAGWQYQSAHIYHRSFMTEPSGPYKGYPMRTWDGNNYRGGFSDHFPTYIVLEKSIK